jgi:c-di-GMP-related signal transduction protein
MPFASWVTVVLASKLPRSAADEDTQRASERACFCESLATISREDTAELYMLGMLSMMDPTLNIPMQQLVGLTSVASQIQGALLGSTKGLGRALELCRYQDHGGDAPGVDPS